MLDETQKMQFIWTVASAALVSALIAGGVVFAWQKSAGEKMRNDAVEEIRQEMQSQIDELEKQVEGLAVEDEFADWQTYRNEEYGFEVKYPEDIFQSGSL